MTNRVDMISRTVFANEHITVFPEGGPSEGVRGGSVVDGQPFETDIEHAKDLDRLGFAEPKNRADLDGEAAPLTPSYQVSVPDLVADQERRANAEKALTTSSTDETIGETGSTAGDIGAGEGDGGAAAAEQEADPAILASTKRRNTAQRSA